ncbi:MAG: hypothetical protein A2Z04_10085 [Chloroflexi bacterium RBG_16_57_9]|nr:MAG: hypothetical protein A2Z04_10085 [Chloroflexi bacterium RBG_16_57_9]
MVEMMQQLEFTGGLPPHELDKLAAIASEVQFKSGEVIFREGDLGNRVYLIVEGQVALERHVPGRGRAVILTIGPGEICGWSALFSGQWKTSDARAVGPVRTIAIVAQNLLAACEADHDLGYLIMQRVATVIAGRLKSTRLQLLDIFASEPQLARKDA